MQKRQLSYTVKFLYKKENIIFKPPKGKNFNHRIFQCGDITKLSGMQSHRLPLNSSLWKYSSRKYSNKKINKSCGIRDGKLGLSNNLVRFAVYKRTKTNKQKEIVFQKFRSSILHNSNTDGMRAGKEDTQGSCEPANTLVSVEGKYNGIHLINKWG